MSLPRRARAALAGGLLAMLTAAGCTSAVGGQPSAADGAAGNCTYSAEGAAAAPAELPPPDAPTSGSPEVVLQTSAGDVPLTLDPAVAPCTVNSFVSLAEQGYFDASPCHRLTTGPGLQVLQCGDPSGTGSGGPGYRFDDETTADTSYPRGTLAMANAGPDTNGSQFFLVYGDAQLPPDYTVFGTISEQGLQTIDAVAAAGSDNANGPGDGAPLTPVQITAAVVG